MKCRLCGAPLLNSITVFCDPCIWDEAQRQRDIQESKQQAMSTTPTTEQLVDVYRDATMKAPYDGGFGNGMHYLGIEAVKNAVESAAQSRIKELEEALRPFESGQLDVSESAVIIGFPFARAALKAAHKALSQPEPPRDLSTITTRL